MYCTKCGAKIDDNDKCCPECGKILNSRNKQLISVNVSPKVIKICVIAIVCICVVGSVIFAVGSKVKKDTAMHEQEKKVKNIGNMLSGMTDIKDFKCHIDATSDLDATFVDQVGDENTMEKGECVKADAIFKNDAVHIKNGITKRPQYDESFGRVRQDIDFQTYVKKSNAAYISENREAFYRVDTKFSKKDMLDFFGEISENFNKKQKYSTKKGKIIITGKLSDGTKIYNTYTRFLNLGGVSTYSYTSSDPMEYRVEISEKTNQLESVDFYLEDVSQIWLGDGSDGLQISTSTGELNIRFKAFSNIKNFELPDEISDVEDEEDVEKADDTSDEKTETSESETLEDWKKIYIDFFNEHNELSEISAGCYLVDVTGDDVPEIFCRSKNVDCCYYINKADEVKQVIQKDYDIPMFYAQNVVGYSGGAHDIVYNYNESTGEFEKVFEGGYSEDAECYISSEEGDEECSNDEYDDALDAACLNEKSTYIDLDSQKGDGTIIEELEKY